MTEDLKARLKQAALLLPIRRNDTADYAEVFGQDFQAMTMTPERFEALSALPEAAARIEALEAAVTLALPVIERELFVMLDSCCAQDDAGRPIRSTLECPSDDVTQMEAAIAACRKALAGGGNE